MREPPTVLGVPQTLPSFDVPRGACDCHVHIFGPPARFPMDRGRTYTPAPASVADLLGLQMALRLDRVVLTQPTPYVSDNSCLLDALSQLGPRARGVVAVDRTTPDTTLREMHDKGVWAARVNLETAGQTNPAAARIRVEDAASRVAPLGWHVETYTNLSVIAALADVLLNFPTTLVLDHFGRAHAARGPYQEGFEVLQVLMRTEKAYVKLSAPYWIAQPPHYEHVEAIARALITANPVRVLWGTDWPHAGAAPGADRRPGGVHPFRAEDDGASLNRLAQWAADPVHVRRILVENPARLYGFA